MEELKLEHIAKRLPYGLKVLNGWGEIAPLTSSLLTHTKFKPILIPLSDLIKEIEHNGEKFVPMLKLISYFDDEYLSTSVKVVKVSESYFICTYDSLGGDIIEFEYQYGYGFDLFNIVEDNRWINQVEYLLIIHLLEWHFDVDNLIEKGLAIDVNTLEENPYK